jgi:hypothetical protein
VTGKGVYHHKFLVDGSLDLYKAHWVLCSFTQWAGIDFEETFGPVAKLATIQVVLILALSYDWPIHR